MTASEPEPESEREPAAEGSSEGASPPGPGPASGSVSKAGQESEPAPLDPETATRLRRHGALLIALGIAGILWGVFHVLGPVGDLQRRFPGQRVGYDMVKVEVHRAFLGGLLRSLAGLGLAMWGGRLRRLGGAGES